MSGVFQNIDPPPPSPPGECVPPPLLRGEDTLAAGWRGEGGGVIFWKTQYTTLYSTYIESSLYRSIHASRNCPLTNQCGISRRKPAVYPKIDQWRQLPYGREITGFNTRLTSKLTSSEESVKNLSSTFIFSMEGALEAPREDKSHGLS